MCPQAIRRQDSRESNRVLSSVASVSRRRFCPLRSCGFGAGKASARQFTPSFALDARHGFLQKLSRQALCLRPHADSFLALAWPPGPSRHLYLPQRDRHRYGLQPALAAVLPVTARLHALSDIRRRPKRHSSHHVVDSRDVERNATEGGIDLDRIYMIYKIWNLRKASHQPSNLVRLSIHTANTQSDPSVPPCARARRRRRN